VKPIYIPLVGLTLGGLIAVGAGGNSLVNRGDQTPDAAVGVLLIGFIALVIAGGIGYHASK